MINDAGKRPTALHDAGEDPKMPLSKPLLTTHEVAELMRVREATVRAWIHDLDLRAIRVGREYRVTVSDLEAFVEASATRPPDPPRADPAQTDSPG
jgi:excisionase family DNA binding protein